MRQRTMRQVRAALDAGEKTTPEFEAEVERDAQRCEVLYRLVHVALMGFLQQFPDSGPDVIAPALIRAAALHCMAGWEMGVDDFTELARCVAEGTRQEADAMRKKATNVGRS